jgi:hypothetical protein
MKRLILSTVTIGLASAFGAYAQVNSGSAVFQNISITGDPAINSGIMHPRVYNDYPGATLTTVNNYPSLVSFSESNVVAPTGFANRDDWRFSSDGGVTDHLFQNNEYWSVAFGGPLPFYSFGNTFNSGDTVLMGMTYENIGGTNGIVYSANGVNSPFLPMSNLEQGVINDSTLGGYVQIVGVVPEPSVFALLVLGILPLLLRRRR